MSPTELSASLADLKLSVLSVCARRRHQTVVIQISSVRRASDMKEEERQAVLPLNR